jgi:flagellin
MVINTNIAALNTYNQMSKNEKSLSTSLQKLSSGSRINGAADDPAGLAISQKMTTQINGLNTATSNAQNGISLVQTADGALSETQSILQNMSELAVQSANDTNTTQDRTNTQSEITQLQSEIDRISNTTQFNTKNLIDGSMSGVSTAGANVSTSAVLDTAGAAISDTSANFTDLEDSNGNSLGIANGDTITMTYNVGGKTVTNSLEVGTTGTTVGDLQNLLSQDGGSTFDGTLANGVGSDGSTPNGTLTVTSANNGKNGAIDGLTLTVADSTGTVKSAASNALSSFTETTAATDAHTNDGSATFQVGANSNQTVKLQIGDMSSLALGVSGINVTSQTGANSAITAINNAIQKVSSQRANLGSVQDRLNDTINNLTTESQNMTAASSQITDVDMAQEMMQYTKENILDQASQAMLAQANQLPQGALQLLK